MKKIILLLFAALFFPALAPLHAPVHAAPPAIEKPEPGVKASLALPLKRIDWRHILSGQINAQGQATGFHYAGVDFVPRSARVVKAGRPDSMGVVRAKVEIYDPKTSKWIAKISESTLFPNSWTRAQLESEVEAAYQAARLTRILDGGSWSWRGQAPSGLLIQGVVDKDGTVRTAYPLYGAEKAKAGLSNP